MSKVFCQKWEESERGWGTRPDGFSLHPTMYDLERFIKEYWDKQPDSVPDSYSRPSGTPYVCEYDIDFNDVDLKGKKGVWFGENTPYPVPLNVGEGLDGWCKT